MSNINFLRKQLYASIDEWIEFILFMGADAIKDELYDFFDFKNTPITSAFVQQRQKLKFEALLPIWIEMSLLSMKSNGYMV